MSTKPAVVEIIKKWKVPIDIILKINWIHINRK
jgi:hypothetical protein